MPNAKTKIDQEYDGPVNVMLTGGRVTSSFRQALFLAAGRSGMTVNEFALRAAGVDLVVDRRALPANGYGDRL